MCEVPRCLNLFKINNHDSNLKTRSHVSSILWSTGNPCCAVLSYFLRSILPDQKKVAQDRFNCLGIPLDNCISCQCYTRWRGTGWTHRWLKCRTVTWYYEISKYQQKTWRMRCGWKFRHTTDRTPVSVATDTCDIAVTVHLCSTIHPSLNRKDL